MQTEQEVISHFLTDAFNDILKIEEKTIETSDFPDLSLREIHVLEAVWKSETVGENTSTKIATALNITPGTLTTLVNVLVRKGYLTKEKDVKDKRVVRIFVTEQGTAAQQMHLAFHADMVTTVMEELSQEEAKVLSKSLEKLVAFFQNKKNYIYGGNL